MPGSGSGRPRRRDAVRRDPAAVEPAGSPQRRRTSRWPWSPRRTGTPGRVALAARGREPAGALAPPAVGPIGYVAARAVVALALWLPRRGRRVRRRAHRRPGRRCASSCTPRAASPTPCAAPRSRSWSPFSARGADRRGARQRPGQGARRPGRHHADQERGDRTGALRAAAARPATRSPAPPPSGTSAPTSTSCVPNAALVKFAIENGFANGPRPDAGRHLQRPAGQGRRAVRRGGRRPVTPRHAAPRPTLTRCGAAPDRAPRTGWRTRGLRRPDEG